MGKDYHRRVSDLESRFASIKDDFDTCSSNIQNDQFLSLKDLAEATGRAMSSLKTLVHHLGSSQPLSITNSVLADTKSAWFAVNSCGEFCCRSAREYRDSAFSHGDDLKKWSKEAKLVEAELHSSLRAAQSDVASETTSLQRYHQDIEVAKSAVYEMSRDNMEVQQKYIRVHEKLQIAVQARERSLKKAEVNLDKSKMRVNKAETRLDGYKSRLGKLSALAQKVAGIQAKGHALSRRYRAIREDAADALEAMNSLKTAYRQIADLISMMSIGMYKPQTAEYLLSIMDAALDDCTLVSELAELVQFMEYCYDTTARVHSITTREHPYGLFSGVQKKLRSQQARIEPSRSFDMYSIRDVNAKSLATLNVDMVRSILAALDRDEHRPLRVSPCRVGRGELIDMLRYNIRMSWGDALQGDY
ncbi:hypothetical protein N0V84_010111 [Fusarium piperis]|uniref:Uncharacterized protein n=1 Tax=Fusarium piperis TaxID=1435070 RepID=A0A9W9BJ86_9HYPO|nr:hypothetical protein N0V84_010111 [Fusarium piperis]